MIMRLTILAFSLVLLTGCDQVTQRLGIADPVRQEAAQQAEGKAVGGACRQSGRAIEDCYAIYNWLPKASVYDGWKEMDAYMRENQLETVAPQLPPAESPAAIKKRQKAEAAAAKAAAKAAADADPEKAGGAPEDKSGKH